MIHSNKWISFCTKHFRSLILVTILISNFLLFFIGISNFQSIYFDENHYIPAAKQWLNMSPTTTFEHPPLGKYILAISIAVFGDNPIGWRLLCIVSGVISTMLCIFIAELLFKDLILAILIGLYSIFGFMFNQE